ncbi:Methyltransferase-like protein [Echinococcus granulosus]|uniref:Alpha N-terminal protein methyltransferase 1 n=1 Tax=Echinococcus granulosus TaxID=6210 RepID=W6U036_ECHGR|nr:Methyltransferase-like protein [Echinococcus granulosus]EUB54378.1 Methyltransferase-like protein [Echinococcus granulosus]
MCSETTSTKKSKRLKKEVESEEVDTPPDFYLKSAKYWSGVDATVNGMLGGLTQVHWPDIVGSRYILARFVPSLRECALDCGAGIGRITKHLLLPYFTTVDMVDMTGKFLDASSAYIGRPNADRVGNRFCCPLQDFTPPEGRYDIIWVQWVIGHLTLSASAKFLRRCAAALRPCDSTATSTATVPIRRSIIVLKDNVFSGAKSRFREVESSFVRTHDELLEVFRKAKLRVLLDERQTNMPSYIRPIYAFVLVPQAE